MLWRIAAAAALSGAAADVLPCERLASLSLPDAAITRTVRRGGTVQGHPETLRDFARRAVHAIALKGRALGSAFYDARRGARTSTAVRPAAGRR
jgi:hypothetical protein